MTEEEKPRGYQHAVIQDSHLEQYTRDGWEFVQLIDVPGTEMMHKVDHYASVPPPQGTYHQPPIVSSASGPSGNVVRWSMTKVLVRRNRVDADVQASYVELNEALRKELATAKAEAKVAEDLLTETGNLKRNLEKACDDQRKALEVKQKDFADMMGARDILRKQLDTVELDVGKREMDRILGRFPAPPTSTGISLGDDET